MADFFIQPDGSFRSDFLDCNMPMDGLPVQSIFPIDNVTVPNFFNGCELTEQPAFGIVTPMGNETAIADLHGMDKRCKRLYDDTIQGGQTNAPALVEKIVGATVKIIDVAGNGLHHLHGNTVFERTVFYPVCRGAKVFVTPIEEGLVGFVTATQNAAGEYKLFRALGAGDQKKRRNP